MRVLLISGNTAMLPDPVAPLGLAYVSSAVRSHGHEVRCLDLCFSERIEDALQGAFLHFRPEVVGISLRNIDNVSFPQTVSYLPFYKELVAACRRLSRAPVILGGAGFTLMPGEILNHLQADGGIPGEGEEVFPQLLAHPAWREDGPPPAIAGFQARGQPGFSPPARIGNLDDLPPPDWDSLDPKNYFDHGGMGNLQTKRGCPFECLYCTYPLIEGRHFRLRPPARVADEAQDLAQRGIANLFIVDNVFNLPENHALEVCRSFRERGLALEWSCYAHPACFTPRLAEEMRGAGCTGVEFGTDSGSPSVLARLGKHFTPAEVRRATGTALAAGLEVCHSLSLGAPGETMETLRETYDLMEELSPTAVIAMVGLRVFPGTGLARLAREEGLVPPDHDLLEPAFYIAPGMQERILESAREMAQIHAHWIFPGLGINVSPRVQSKLRRIGVKGPLWEHMKILRQRRAVRGAGAIHEFAPAPGRGGSRGNS